MLLFAWISLSRNLKINQANAKRIRMKASPIRKRKRKTKQRTIKMCSCIQQCKYIQSIYLSHVSYMFLAYWTRFSCLRTRALNSPACFFSSSPNVLPGMVGYDMIAWRYEKITASIQVGSLFDVISGWVVFVCYTTSFLFSGDLRWTKKVLVITKLCRKSFQGLSCVMIDLNKDFWSDHIYPYKGLTNLFTNKNIAIRQQSLSYLVLLLVR